MKVMPPPNFDKGLTARQQVLIRARIEQAAKYAQLWAFTPVVKAPLPVLAIPAEEVANPIDAFVLATLEAGKIEPSSPADKATLLRRLALDLTGMPPRSNAFPLNFSGSI